VLRNRPTCLTTALGVLLLASTAAAQNNRSPIPDFAPDYHFQGSQLTGWRTVGQATWRAQNGEIIGTANAGGGGGWVVLERPLQDVGFYTRFRCAAECNTGVLLRAQQTPQGMKGIFVSLNPNELGNYAVTIDNTGRIVTKERLRNAGGQVRFAPAPNPNAPQGGGGGGGGGGGAAPANLPPAFRANDWNTLLVNLDADLIRPSLNSAGRIPSSATADSSAGFGPVALYVGGPGEVRFSAVSVKDLGNRKVSAEQVGSNFRISRIDGLHYAWDAAVADINRDGQNDIVSGPYYYLGPDYTTRREIYPGRSYNPSSEYVPNMVTHAADFTGDGWPDVLATESRQMALYVNPKGEARRWVRHLVLPGVTTENTLMRDLNGDGRLEIVYGIGGGIAHARRRRRRRRSRPCAPSRSGPSPGSPAARTRPKRSARPCGRRRSRRPSRARARSRSPSRPRRCGGPATERSGSPGPGWRTPVPPRTRRRSPASRPHPGRGSA